MPQDQFAQDEAAPQREPGPLTRWSGTPTWYLWEGGFLALGRSQGVVPPHEHHAIQIVVSVDGQVGIRGAEGDWRMAPGIVILPHVVHSYNSNGVTSAMLFVDPESAEGAWLASSMRDEITTLPEARASVCALEIRKFLDRPLEGLEISALAQHCVRALCVGPPPSRRLDRRVTQVLARIRESDDLRMSIEEAAALAFLSPSRFAHLFKQQVGLPFRRYMLWRKLTRAVLLIGRDGSITQAAHEADFADAAHLTRTFYQMFGIPPSVMMRGTFFEVPPPFDLPVAAPRTR